jgi:hypothetical protein
MTAKHTPGPWRQAQYCTNAVVCDSPTGHNDDGNIRYYGGYLVAESIFEPANARLIAAAPMLLDALQDAEMRIRGYLDLLKCDEEFKANETQMIRAAIAAATKES